MPTDLAVQQDAISTSPALDGIALIQQALSSGASPESIRELVALQQSMERFAWEREERQSRIDFDDALVKCQIEIGNIAPNRERENKIMWADYLQIDRKIRPIYTKAGFSISYSEAPAPPGKVKVIATLSRSGISRTFEQMITAAVNSKMAQPDVDASANARCQRYLVLKIFNIAIGIDKDEKAGIEDDRYLTMRDELEGAPNFDEAQKMFRSFTRELLETKKFDLIGKLDSVWSTVRRQLEAQ